MPLGKGHESVQSILKRRSATLIGLMHEIRALKRPATSRCRSATWVFVAERRLKVAGRFNARTLAMPNHHVAERRLTL